eukprot:9606493-Karenia_brevis.AAC.1
MNGRPYVNRVGDTYGLRTACQGLRDYLVNLIVAGCEDKRLEIHLDGLREYLWDKPDGNVKEDIEEDQWDK